MSTELQTTNPTITPLKSMRQVETTEQLEWILEKSKHIIKNRDDYYEANRNYIENSDKEGNLNQEYENVSKPGAIINASISVFLMGVFFLLFIPIIYLIYVAAIILISSILIAIGIIKLNQKKIKNQYNLQITNVDNYKNIMINIEHELENQQNFFWCAEIIPIEYRNQKAVEIMLSAIRKSRADNWKECCDIYDKECERQDMRKYQAAQLALSQEAATNSKWAAAGAWATFGAVLFK
jgi:hypothetical protein